MMGLNGRGGLMLQFKETSKIVFFLYVLTVRGGVRGSVVG
jgi:hypothetical protein